MSTSKEGDAESRVNNSVTSETGSMVSVTNDRAERFSNSRLTTAAILAFIPNFGILGVHDFILRQYKRGITHATIVVVCFVGIIMIGMPCGYYDYCHNAAIIISFLYYLALASYIWSIVEGILILRSKRRKVFAPSAVNDSSVTHSSKLITGVSDTSNNDACRPYLKSVTGAEREKKQGFNAWSVLSIIATIIPIMLWTYCFMISGGRTSEDGPGAIWWFIIAYYCSLGIPLVCISIAFGILGLKTHSRWLSIISLLLKIATIIAVVLLLLVHFKIV